MWGAIKKAINSNLNKPLDVLIQESATELNTKVDGRASQTSLDSVKNLVQDGNNLVGANNNSGGSIGVGSISARINKLLTDWTTTRAGYVDTAISSRASQSSLNTLQGTANTINANVGSLVNGRVVKSVQRGVVTLNSSTNSPNYKVPHIAVDINKSILILNGWSRYNGGGYDSSPVIASREPFAFTLIYGKDAFYHVSWEIIEFY